MILIFIELHNVASVLMTLNSKCTEALLLSQYVLVAVLVKGTNCYLSSKKKKKQKTFAYAGVSGEGVLRDEL